MAYSLLFVVALLLPASHSEASSVEFIRNETQPLSKASRAVALLHPKDDVNLIVAAVPALLGQAPPLSPAAEHPMTPLFRDSARGYLSAQGSAYAVGTSRGIAVIPKEGRPNGTFVPFLNGKRRTERFSSMIPISTVLVNRVRRALEQGKTLDAQVALQESFDTLRRSPEFFVDLMHPADSPRWKTQEKAHAALRRNPQALIRFLLD